MAEKRVKSIESGRTGVIIGSIGMCYNVRMDDNGEVLSGGKKRWRIIPEKREKAVMNSKELSRDRADAD